MRLLSIFSPLDINASIIVNKMPSSEFLFREGSRITACFHRVSIESAYQSFAVHPPCKCAHSNSSIIAFAMISSTDLSLSATIPMIDCARISRRGRKTFPLCRTFLLGFPPAKRGTGNPSCEYISSSSSSMRVLIDAISSVIAYLAWSGLRMFSRALIALLCFVANFFFSFSSKALPVFLNSLANAFRIMSYSSISRFFEATSGISFSNSSSFVSRS